MRLSGAKKQKWKPSEAHKAVFHGNSFKGRPRTKMKEFTREGAMAIRARLPLPGDGNALTPWRWYAGCDRKGEWVDSWFHRKLMPISQARSLAASFKAFDGAKVKLVTVWRKPGGSGNGEVL